MYYPNGSGGGGGGNGEMEKELVQRPKLGPTKKLQLEEVSSRPKNPLFLGLPQVTDQTTTDSQRSHPVMMNMGTKVVVVVVVVVVYNHKMR